MSPPLGSLSTWSPVGGTVWEALGELQYLRFHIRHSYQASLWSLLVNQDSNLLYSSHQLLPSPPPWTLSPETLSTLNTKFYALHWSECFVTADRKVRKTEDGPRLRVFLRHLVKCFFVLFFMNVGDIWALN